MATNFEQNRQNDLYFTGWRFETISNNGSFDLTIFSANIVATLYTSLIKIGPVTPEITRVRTALFSTRRQKLAYPTEYLSNY